jgi:hypothetical protein
MCGKTGTAENKLLIDGKVRTLTPHSLFVCFAPRDNPKIVVAVIVENGGHGAYQAAPIASLLVEKYLNDTIATDRLALEDDITNRNLMPRYLVYKQFKADSLRAVDWAEQTDDSSRWIKYQTPSFRHMMLDTSDDSKSPLMQNLRKPAPYRSALAERLARQKAQAAAATIGLDSVNKVAPPAKKDSIRQPDHPRPRPAPPADTTHPQKDTTR